MTELTYTCPICGAEMPKHFDSCILGFLNNNVGAEDDVYDSDEIP